MTTSTSALRLAARTLLLAGAAVVAYLVFSFFDQPARADSGDLTLARGDRPPPILPVAANAGDEGDGDDGRRGLPVVGGLLDAVGGRDETPQAGEGAGDHRVTGRDQPARGDRPGRQDASRDRPARQAPAGDAPGSHDASRDRPAGQAPDGDRPGLWDAGRDGPAPGTRDPGAGGEASRAGAGPDASPATITTSTDTAGARESVTRPPTAVARTTLTRPPASRDGASTTTRPLTSATGALTTVTRPLTGTGGAAATPAPTGPSGVVATVTRPLTGAGGAAATAAPTGPSGVVATVTRPLTGTGDGVLTGAVRATAADAALATTAGQLPATDALLAPVTGPLASVDRVLNATTRPLASVDDTLAPVTPLLTGAIEGAVVGVAEPVLRVVHQTAGAVDSVVAGVVRETAGAVEGVVGVAEPVLRVVHEATGVVVGVAEPVLRVVQQTAGAVLEPVVAVVAGAVDWTPPQDGAARPTADLPAAESLVTVVRGPVAAAAVERWALVIGPRIGANSSITKPPRQPLSAALAARSGGTGPAAPWRGLGGCAPGGCAHTSDAITAGGQPVVLPATPAVRPEALGRLVAPPAGPAFAGRLPGVSPLPG